MESIDKKNKSSKKRTRKEIIDDIIDIQQSCVKLDDVNNKTGKFDDDKFCSEVIALVYSEVYK